MFNRSKIAISNKISHLFQAVKDQLIVKLCLIRFKLAIEIIKKSKVIALLND